MTPRRNTTPNVIVMRTSDCTYPRPAFDDPFSTHLSRGHIGLSAFHHILTDPRVQGIPLVLETPSFEKPEQVWKKEIDVLNHLSLTSDQLGDNEHDMGSVIEIELEKWAEELKEVVVAAGGGKEKEKVVKRVGKGKKRKREEYEDDDKNGESGECSH